MLTRNIRYWLGMLDVEKKILDADVGYKMLTGNIRSWLGILDVE